MGKRNLVDYKIGETFMAFLLLRKVESKIASNGNKYLDMTLGDCSGEINARFWDCKDEDERKYTDNMLVKIKGNVTEWQGKKQIKVERIRPVKKEDDVKISEFIPAAPYSGETMYGELHEYTLKIDEDKLRELVQLIIAESGERLLIFPAATQNHHAIRSGLLYHTLTMLKAGERMMEVYPFLNKDILYAGIILHDMAKQDEIKANELGLASEYTTEGQLLGHIVQGIKKIDRAADTVGLDPEKTILLEHMLLSHHYEPEFGSPKRPMVPEAEMLHYLDVMDTRMYDMQKALNEVENGEFSDKVWVLHNRRLYKAGNKGFNE